MERIRIEVIKMWMEFTKTDDFKTLCLHLPEVIPCSNLQIDNNIKNIFNTRYNQNITDGQLIYLLTHKFIENDEKLYIITSTLEI